MAGADKHVVSLAVGGRIFSRRDKYILTAIGSALTVDAEKRGGFLLGYGANLAAHGKFRSAGSTPASRFDNVQNDPKGSPVCGTFADAPTAVDCGGRTARSSAVDPARVAGC